MAVPNLTIEGRVWGAWEYQALQEALGLAKPADAIGRVASLWQWCLTEETDIAPAKVVEAHLGRGGAEAIVECDLGEVTDGGIRIRGTQKRIDQWQQRQTEIREAGKKRAADAQRKGGRFLPTGDRSEAHEVTSAGPAQHQHRSSDSPASFQRVTSLDQPSPSLSASPSPPVQAEPPLTPLKGGSPRRSRKPTHSDEQVDAAKRTLAHIAKRTGVQYQGAEPHVKLIAARLADPGVTEHDLRCVVAYCWDPSGLDWKNATTSDGVPMAKHLVPETLFGPKKLHKYLEPARAWYREHIAPKAREATPEQSNQPVMLVASQIRSAQ